MIPKIIHYTWFSADPYPEVVQRCLDSWHRLMPDWEFRLWDAEAIRHIDSLWLRECLQARKWAFAADFVRLYAVEKYGGIYLDTDCILHRPLDELAQASDAFIGQEWYVNFGYTTSWRHLTSHCFGAVSHHPFLQRCLHYYDNRHFLLSSDATLPDNLRFDQTLLPQIQCQLAMQMYGYDPTPTSQIQHLSRVGEESAPDTLTVYPSRYLGPYTLRSQTYCQHLALGGWYQDQQTSGTQISFFKRLRISFDYRLSRLMWHLGYVLIRKCR